MGSYISNIKLPKSEIPGFVPGKVIHIMPLSAYNNLDFTTPVGTASGILYSFLFQLRRWGFKVEKVEELMEVSPVHAQYYQITIQQKQQLEAQIKSGIAGVATAVGDLELLMHDQRKYKDFLNYFEKIERGKKEKNEKMAMEGEQSLKAIFIDEVDVHTGEGIALKLIAPRWPTIIADFMQLTDGDTEQKAIKEKYKLPEAEGVVLATKNKLYKQWKNVFRKTIESRYENIVSLVEARRKSVIEYRNMVKPYVVKYRSIKEAGETYGGRRLLEEIAWIKQGAQAVSINSLEFWAFKPFHPPEMGKAGIEAFEEKRPVLAIPFPLEFKERITREWKLLEKEKMTEISTFPTGIEPLDDFVVEHLKGIEEMYKVRFSIVDILKTRENFAKMYTEQGWAKDPYFAVLEMPVFRTTMRFASGDEIEDILFGLSTGSQEEWFRTSVDTQNVILLRLLELKAKELELENFITEFLGESVRTPEGKILSIKEAVKEEYPFVFGGEEKKEEVKKVGKTKSLFKSLESGLKYFVRPGPYENTFIDRVSSLYFKEAAAILMKPASQFLKGAMGVPG